MKSDVILFWKNEITICEDNSFKQKIQKSQKNSFDLYSNAFNKLIYASPGTSMLPSNQEEFQQCGMALYSIFLTSLAHKIEW